MIIRRIESEYYTEHKFSIMIQITMPSWSTITLAGANRQAGKELTAKYLQNGVFNPIEREWKNIKQRRCLVIDRIPDCCQYEALDSDEERADISDDGRLCSTRLAGVCKCPLVSCQWAVGNCGSWRAQQLEGQLEVRNRGCGWPGVRELTAPWHCSVVIEAGKMQERYQRTKLTGSVTVRSHLGLGWFPFFTWGWCPSITWTRRRAKTTHAGSKQASAVMWRREGNVIPVAITGTCVLIKFIYLFEEYLLLFVRVLKRQDQNHIYIALEDKKKRLKYICVCVCIGWYECNEWIKTRQKKKRGESGTHFYCSWSSSRSKEEKRKKWMFWVKSL